MVDQSSRRPRTGWDSAAGYDLAGQGPATGIARNNSGPYGSYGMASSASGPGPSSFQGSSHGAGPSPGNGHRGNGHRGNGHAGSASGAATSVAFDPHRASTGELVSQAAGQISTLVRSELALGKAELTEKGKAMGLGGGMIAGAGMLSLFCFALVITLGIVALDLVWPLWLAVLVPLLVLGALTIGLAGIGVMKLRKGPPVPAEAANSVRDDLRSMRHAIHEGRR